MAAPVSSYLKLQERRVEEIINKTVDVMMPAVDPIFKDMISTSQGVAPSGMLGRDYEVYKTFMGGLSGAIDQAGATDEFTLYGDTAGTGQNANYLGNKLMLQNVNNTFPSAQESPSTVPYFLKFGLRGWNTNLPLTLAELRAEATPALIGQVLTPKFRGFGQNMAQMAANYFYLSQNTNYTLATISDIALSTMTDGTNTIYTIKFTPSNYAIYRFMVGQRVDVHVNDGGVPGWRLNDTATGHGTVGNAGYQTVNTRQNLFVVAVDEIANKVTLGSTIDPTTWAGNGGTDVTNGDHVVYANSRKGAETFKGIAGINSWLKFGTSGSVNDSDFYLLGAEATGTDTTGRINVNSHPEFKSFLKNIGGVLTETKLKRCIRGFTAAKERHGDYIDTLIASEGVWAAYESQKIPMHFIDRTSRLVDLSKEGSEENFAITVGGRTYKGHTSRYVETGVMYGIRKGGNNWKRYVPPQPAGATTSPDAPAGLPFRFIGGILTGTSSNRLPVYKSVTSHPYGSTNTRIEQQLTEMAQMPGMMYMQVAPDRPVGLKLTGITEEREFSDTAFSS